MSRRYGYTVSAGGAYNYYLNSGESLVPSGALIIQGNLIGINNTSLNPGETGSLALSGVYNYLAEENESFEVGDSLYLKKLPEGTPDEKIYGRLTKTSGGDLPYAGFCWVKKETGASTVVFKLGH